MRKITPLRDVQFRLEYLLLRTIAGMIRLMPLEVATGFSAWSWSVLAPRVAKKRHTRALDNLKIAFPEKTEEERAAIAHAHWQNLGRVMAETMQMDRILAEPERMQVVPEKMFARYSGKLGAGIGAGPGERARA